MTRHRDTFHLATPSSLLAVEMIHHRHECVCGAASLLQASCLHWKYASIRVSSPGRVLCVCACLFLEGFPSAATTSLSVVAVAGLTEKGSWRSGHDPASGCFHRSAWKGVHPLSPVLSVFPEGVYTDTQFNVDLLASIVRITSAGERCTCCAGGPRTLRLTTTCWRICYWPAGGRRVGGWQCVFFLLDAACCV